MELIGNLLDFADSGAVNVVVHGCNCFCTMGAGIAKEIKQRYPSAYEADSTLTTKGDKNKLGQYTWVKVSSPSGKEFFIINAYTQYNYGRGLHVNYDAVRSVFSAIAKDFPNSVIGYPKIGAGLGGGDWLIIKGIIDNELNGLTHYFVVLKK